MNFYPFHIGDYISHTSHLSDAEDLAYRRMIDLYYQTEQPFKDVSLIARKVKSTVEIVQTLLIEFFEETPEGYINKRCDEEIEKYHFLQESGKRGAEKRWANANSMPPYSHPIATPIATKNQEPRTKNHNINTPDGVSESIFKDYLEVRKAKKAKWTETALKGLQREADKAKMSLQDVMQLCCERNWVGFKAEWAKEEIKTQDKPTAKWHQSVAGVMAKGKELGILPKPGETEGQYRERLMGAGA